MPLHERLTIGCEDRESNPEAFRRQILSLRTPTGIYSSRAVGRPAPNATQRHRSPASNTGRTTKSATWPVPVC
jgi:hypothetical protein